MYPWRVVPQIVRFGVLALARRYDVSLRFVLDTVRGVMVENGQGIKGKAEATRGMKINTRRIWFSTASPCEKIGRK